MAAACQRVVDGLPMAEVTRISTVSGPSRPLRLVSRQMICGSAALPGPPLGGSSNCRNKAPADTLVPPERAQSPLIPVKTDRAARRALVWKAVGEGWMRIFATRKVFPRRYPLRGAVSGDELQGNVLAMDEPEHPLLQISPT